MSNLYYIADIAIAISIPLFFYINYKRGSFSLAIWKLFWVGFIIGLTWEFTFFFIGPEFSDDPAFTLIREFPLPPILQPTLHTFWDGGLFMIGVWLVFRLCKPPQLTRFRRQELGVLLAWGQAQEFAVELSATSVGAWTYNPKWWNPVLFEFGKGEITLMPQIIWLVAPIVFYLIALRIVGALGNNSTADSI